jgi:microsomal dipeptidase-like Zn-dependent dipeptidase
MTEIPEYQIAKLSPKAGDIIVVKVDRTLSKAQLEQVGQHVMPYFEEVGCKVVVLGGDVDLQVVEQVPARRPAHIYARADGQEVACGFPVLCPECEADQTRKYAERKS